MPFHPLAWRTRAGSRDPGYIAEPKLDGQRAQLHVREHRTVHAFSRPGRELIELPGLAWLLDIRWPVASGRPLTVRQWPAIGVPMTWR